MQTLDLNIFDIAFRIETDSDYVFENLQKDFWLYLGKHGEKGGRVLKLKALQQRPPYERVPPVEASFYHIGLICYKHKNTHYVDYMGRGLMIYDFSEEFGEIYHEDEIFLYERTRLTVLSRLGELLDAVRLHRVHAVGFAKNNEAVICILPMGGGKTTIALSLLRQDASVSLIADDVCFIDGKGYVHPFLLRIGARDQALLEGISPQFITEINRPYYGVKYFLEPTYFKDRVAEKTKVQYILVGKRVFQDKTDIRRMAKPRCFMPFVWSGVMGFGLPQLFEFFVRMDFSFLLNRIGAAFSRSVLFIGLIMRAKTYEIRLGRDLQDSVGCLSRFLSHEQGSALKENLC